MGKNRCCVARLGRRRFLSACAVQVQDRDLSGICSAQVTMSVIMLVPVIWRHGGWGSVFVLCWQQYAESVLDVVRRPQDMLYLNSVW